MKDRQYNAVRAMVAIDDAKTRKGLLSAFKKVGIVEPSNVDSVDGLRAALAERAFDLIVMSEDVGGVFAAPIISEVRRGQLGPHSFPIVVVLMPESDALHKRKVSDCGPDDIVVMPVAMDALLERIGGFVEGDRQPLVVTAGYAGPERRTKGGRTGPAPS